jgi:hypothetical protein
MKLSFLGFLCLVPSLFADVELCLTDTGSCSSGDFVVLDGTGAVISSGGSESTFSHISPTGGVINWVGQLGNYAISVTTGFGSPTEPPATLSLNTTNFALGGSSGHLDMFFSETGVTPAFPGWDLTFTGTLNSRAGATVQYKAFEHNGNAFFATTTPIGTIGPFGPGLFTGTAAGLVGGVTTPYTLTQEILLNGVGPTTLNGAQGTLDPVPEPFSVFLFGSVLLACASGLRRRWNSRN